MLDGIAFAHRDRGAWTSQLLSPDAHFWNAGSHQMAQRFVYPEVVDSTIRGVACDLRVGLDVVSIAEIARAIDRFGERYIRRVFTVRERAYCLATNRKASAARFAARFAAKEATVKVLRPARPWFDWRAIEVRRHRSGWCEIRLHDSAAELAARQHLDTTTMALSMTHGDTRAAAVVLARADIVRPPEYTGVGTPGLSTGVGTPD
jgi:holo-[acyl-carrier protein] synthase